MAGDWIKVRIDLQSHPKIVRILSATDSDKFRAIGGLHAVWSIFDTHSEDGVLLGYSAKTLDHVIGWQGFTDAMIGVGWVEEVDGGLVMPGFDEHNGKSGKRRAEDQKRKREGRKDPQVVRNSSAGDAEIKRTREEKRREDKEIPPLKPPVEKTAAAKKTKIPTPFLVTSEMRTWAAESAPGVELKTETEKFVDYWRGEAKTKADWPATWRNWMRKAQQDHNRPGPRGSAPVNRQQQIEDENARVVREMFARDALHDGKGDGIDLGDVVSVDGELIDVE